MKTAEVDAVREYLLDYAYSKNRILKYSAIVALGLTDLSSGSQKNLDFITNLIGSVNIEDNIFGLYYFGLAFFGVEKESVDYAFMIRNVSSQKLIEAITWGLSLAYLGSGNKKIEDFFTSWLRDKNVIRRIYGLLGLGLITWGTRSKTLLSSSSILINDPNIRIRQNAILALGLSYFGSVDQEVKTFLRGLLASNRNPQIRATIIKTLGLLGFGTGDEELARTLQLMMNQPNIIILENAIRALALIYFNRSDKAFINAVSNLMSKANPKLHSTIAEGIGYVYFGTLDPEAQNFIQILMGKKNNLVINSCLRSLGFLASGTGDPTINSVLQSFFNKKPLAASVLLGLGLANWSTYERSILDAIDAVPLSPSVSKYVALSKGLILMGKASESDINRFAPLLNHKSININSHGLLGLGLAYLGQGQKSFETIKEDFFKYLALSGMGILNPKKLLAPIPL